jgi:tyrosine-protein phosphatase SIW14
MAGLGKPNDGAIAKVMAIVDTKENWPVFIHCERGSDRTGTFVACYHILHDGWAAGKAISEARQYGMSWTEFGMREYISDYYAARKGSPPAPTNVPAVAETHAATTRP